MPRPCKRRRICAEPACRRFGPQHCTGKASMVVTMALDEYETIRLVDLLGMTQEECAQQMGVSRTTAQSIYASARQKLAQCLVNGQELVLEGGDYVLCAEGAQGVGGVSCPHRCSKGGGMAPCCKHSAGTQSP